MSTELERAVKSTTWDIEVEVDEDGSRVYVSGSFSFRDGLVCFSSSNPDYELEVTDLEYEEGQEPSDEDVEKILAHVEKAIHDDLESEAESKVDSAEYDAADEAYYRKVGALRYHGLNPHDF